MTKLSIIAVCVGLAAASSVTMAFEEQKMRPAGQAPAASQPSVKPGGEVGLSLTDPALTATRPDSGTKIRVPGLGLIGEIPKMDFGLELLYGASQPKQPDNDRSEATGVMGRVTVPLKSR